MDQRIAKIIFLIGLVAFYCSGLAGQNYVRSMKRLPDTGQTKSYTNTWGEDSDYLIQPPAYRVFSTGIVFDTVTGLMWQQSDSGELTYEKALQYADTLRLGGFNDWRLPTAHESFSLMNHQNPNPALDGTYFTKTDAEYWWTIDKQANDANKVWVTNGGGGIGNHLKTETISAGGTKKYHVRCVRDVQNPIVLSDRWMDHNDGTVTDNLTGLMWVKAPVFSVNWEEALVRAENHSLAGFTDWRLPNIKELRSLSQEDKWNPSIDKTIFPQITTGRYWSSTSLPNQTTKAWFWDTQFGITTYELKTLAYAALFVRSDVNIQSKVSEAEDQSIYRVYPNPSNQWVQVTGLNEGYDFILSDVNGQVVFSGKWHPFFDISPLTPGSYFISFVTKTGKRKQLVFTKIAD